MVFMGEDDALHESELEKLCQSSAMDLAAAFRTNPTGKNHRQNQATDARGVLGQPGRGIPDAATTKVCANAPKPRGQFDPSRDSRSSF
jgi:hypothetical protein